MAIACTGSVTSVAKALGYVSDWCVCACVCVGVLGLYRISPFPSDLHNMQLDCARTLPHCVIPCRQLVYSIRYSGQIQASST